MLLTVFIALQLYTLPFFTVTWLLAELHTESLSDNSVVVDLPALNESSVPFALHALRICQFVHLSLQSALFTIRLSFHECILWYCGSASLLSYASLVTKQSVAEGDGEETRSVTILLPSPTTCRLLASLSSNRSNCLLWHILASNPVLGCCMWMRPLLPSHLHLLTS